MTPCNVSLQVIPLVEPEKVYPIIDRVIELIAASGIKHRVGPMETTMEGELEDLLNIVRQAQETCLAAGADRIISVVKVDYARGGVTIDEKTSPRQD